MQRSKRYVFVATALLTLFAVGLVQAAPWWEAPALKGASAPTTPNGSGTHYINMDETGNYMICGTGYGVAEAYPLFRVADLNSATLSHAPEPLWSVNGRDDAWTNGLRGGAVSYKLGRVLSGTAGGNTYLDWNVSFPIAGPRTLDETVFAIYNNSNIVFDSADFSSDGKYLYSNFYGAEPNRIWKWNVLNGLATNGTNLTAAASFASPNITQIRTVNVCRVNGKDLVFYGEGATTSGKVCVYDFATETETLLVTATVSAKIMNIKVSGIGLSQMHLHVQMTDGSLQIFELAADGLSTDDQVANFTRADMLVVMPAMTGNVRGYEISNDERYAYIDDFGSTVCVLWTPPVWESAPEKYWWENPGLKYETDITLTEGSHYMNKDASDQWLVCGSVGVKNYNTYLFSLPELRTAQQGTEVTPLAVANAVDIGLGLSPGFRGGAISDDLRIFLSGASGKNGYAALPMPGPWSSATTHGITNDVGVVFDSSDFSHDSTYLFSSSYKAPTNQIWMWNVLNGLATSGVNLTSNKVINTSITRIRSINAYYIGGKDLVYAGEGTSKSGNVYVYDFDTESETLLVTITENSDIMNVKVGGVEGGQMHLYVQYDNGAIYIYSLNADGMSVGALVKHFTPEQTLTFLGDGLIKNMRSFEVTDDETHAFIAYHGDVNRLHVLWAVPAVHQDLVGTITSSVEDESTTVEMGGNFTATYSATSGWVSSVYTNGAPAYDCSAKPTEVTLPLTGIESDINVVVASTQARLAADKWYDNPGVKNDFAQVQAGLGDHCAGWLWSLDATEEFLAAPIQFTGLNTTLYSVESLVSGSTTAINSYTNNTLFAANVRGAAVSKPLNVQLIGSAVDTGYILSLPLNEAAFVENENAFKIFTSNGTTPDSMHFTADGRYFYANGYNPSAARNYIYRYEVLNGLKSSGTNLVLESTWTVGSRVRGMHVAHIDGKDIIYIQSESALYVLDTSSPSNTAQALRVSGGSSYAALTVGGIAAGHPHLYCFTGKTGQLDIYTIKADYTVETTPFMSYTGAQLGEICGYDEVGTSVATTGSAIAVTDDESTLFLGTNVTGLPDRILVIQYVMASYPDWILNCGLTGEDLSDMEGKYTAWAATQTATDLMTTDYSAQFLMNADAEQTVALAITAISLDGEGNISLTIEGTANDVTLDLAEINGELFLRTAEELAGTWYDKTFGTVSANINVEGIAFPEFAGSNGFFFKAVVSFAAPTGSTALTGPALPQ